MASQSTGDMYSSLPEAIASRLQHYKEFVSQNGISGLQESFKEHLDSWKNAKLNIAVTGSSGQGKSTFIDTIRRLKPTDPDGAKTGVKQTTMTIESYPDPQHPNLVYWDLPGCGTPEFPRATYLKQVHFDKYDVFLIITATRFTEEDLWLTEEATRIGKQFFLIRTKVDSDIRNEQEDYMGKKEDEILSDIKNDCLKNLQQYPKAQDRVFLINAKYHGYYKWDFPKRLESLLQDYPAFVREALILILTANSKEVIEEKFQVLEKRILNIALLLAGSHGVPIPGTSLMLDSVLIQNEIQEYKEQFGLDSESLEKLSEIRGVNHEIMRKELSKKGFDTIIFTSVTPYALQLLMMYAPAGITEDFAGLIPNLGWFVVSVNSFCTTYKALQYALNTAKEASLTMLDHVSNTIIQSSANYANE